MKRKICLITGARSEFGIFLPLLKEIRRRPALELQIIATTLHLSPEFGLTYREIESEGYVIHKKVETLLSADTPTAISKSMGLTLMGVAEALSELQPDLVLLLGDRFETLAAAIAASNLRIPIVHLHGGETTEGAVDEAFRHAITKMSLFHFASSETHRQRIIQLGENPERVWNTGALAVDNIKGMALLSREEIIQLTGFQLQRPLAVVTFHPVTLEKATAGPQFQELLSALEERPELDLVITKPNGDAEGRVLISMIDDFAAKHPERVRTFTSLGALRYLSLLRYSRLVVGNSSSGLIEAPYLDCLTLDIGDRQKGRERPVSVLSVPCEKAAIQAGLGRLLSEPAAQDFKPTDFPYGQGGAAVRMADILEKTPLPSSTKKAFFDLDQ